MGKELPKITIVTPSYNQGQYVERTILSVLGQQYPNLEYIIMDGGSTDNSVEIIKRYSSRLSHWESGPDKGQAAAIANGFSISSGTILGWLNSDDMLMPNALMNVAKVFLTSDEICAVTGRCAIVDAKGQLFAVDIPTIRSWTSMLYLGTGFYQMATFWKRSAYDEVGQLDTQMYFSFDTDLFLRLKKYGRISQVSDYLAVYRVHKDSKNANSQPIMRTENRLIQKRYANMNDFIVKLSQVAKRLRPVRRIRNKVFWYIDRHKVVDLCRAAQT